MNTEQKNIVYIFGAGFTRAFFNDSPLLTDYYNIDDIKFERLRYVYDILKLEKKRNSPGKINIENLMTRLNGRMPYDSDEQVKELDLLLFDIMQCFIDRLESAKYGKCYRNGLAKFAAHCIENNINCITFNNDDLFDQALWGVKKVDFTPKDIKYWHPDGGYGFFCRPPDSLVQRDISGMDRTSMLLLKLHGSVNWRIKRGYDRPYYIDAIIHNEKWLPIRKNIDLQTIENHLEKVPFIIPPTLIKSTFVEQPILKLVWSRAYQILKEAKHVFFVGYSLPVTDIAVQTLFREAIHDDCDINIIDLKDENELNEKNDEKNKLIRSYRNVFPKISDEKFDFRGALTWSKDIIKGTI